MPDSAETPVNRASCVQHVAQCTSISSAESSTGHLQALDKHPQLFAAVQARLQERPVWLYPALQEALLAESSSSSHVGLDSVLNALTYRFASGPWQQALVRRGYDPRCEAASWQHQVLTCTLPDTWKGAALQSELAGIAQRALSPWKDANDTGQQQPAVPVSTKYSQVAGFSALPPSKSVFLQVCAPGMLYMFASAAVQGMPPGGHARCRPQSMRNCLARRW